MTNSVQIFKGLGGSWEFKNYFLCLAIFEHDKDLAKRRFLFYVSLILNLLYVFVDYLAALVQKELQN